MLLPECLRFGAVPAIPEPLFPDDDGLSDPGVLLALKGSDQELIDALRGKRLYVAVLSQLVSTNADGGEKESEMALALLAYQGAKALPVFTSLAALETWRADARPVQVVAEAAALQALTDEMVGIIIDGDRALTGRALRALIFNFPLIDVYQDPVVEQALDAAIAPHDQIVTAWLEESAEVDATINLLIPTVHSEDASRIAGAVASWMASDPNVRLRTSKGFDVQVVTAR